MARLTQVEVADVEALLLRQVVQQGAEVGCGADRGQRVAAQLQDLLARRVAKRVPGAAGALPLPTLQPVLLKPEYRKRKGYEKSVSYWCPLHSIYISEGVLQKAYNLIYLIIQCYL